MAKRLGYVIAALVMAASGIYVFVYLYRWEWNRAITAGIFLIASGLALATAALLDRIARLERKIDAADGRNAALPLIESARPEAHRHFAWLRDGDGMNVFVPVLMGAGILVSALAWAVERIAMKTLRPSMEQGLAAQLSTLALPANGLLGTPAAAPAASSGGAWKRLVVVLLVVAGTWGGIDVLADLTQGRPDVRDSGVASEIIVDVRADDADLASDLMAARGLWGACRSTLNKKLETAPVIDQTGPFVRIFVRPALGEHSKRRLVGCMEDGVIDHVQGRVVAINSFSR